MNEKEKTISIEFTVNFHQFHPIEATKKPRTAGCGRIRNMNINLNFQIFKDFENELLDHLASESFSKTRSIMDIG